jgi:hypothetical protein
MNPGCKDLSEVWFIKHQFQLEGCIDPSSDRPSLCAGLHFLGMTAGFGQTVGVRPTNENPPKRELGRGTLQSKMNRWSWNTSGLRLGLFVLTNGDKNP